MVPAVPLVVHTLFHASQPVLAGELAEEHGYELRPAS
jgi:hypothetical protein